MKVHIAYHDCDLIGVYRKRKDAKKALDQIDWPGSGCRIASFQGWSSGDQPASIERDVIYGEEIRINQWIDTYQVTK